MPTKDTLTTREQPTFVMLTNAGIPEALALKIIGDKRAPVKPVQPSARDASTLRMLTASGFNEVEAKREVLRLKAARMWRRVAELKAARLKAQAR